MPTFKEISTFTYNGNPSGSQRIQISSSQSTSLQDVADLSLLTKLIPNNPVHLVKID